MKGMKRLERKISNNIWTLGAQFSSEDSQSSPVHTVCNNPDMVEVAAHQDEHHFEVWAVEPVQKSLRAVLVSRVQLLRLLKEAHWENNPTAPLICSLCKHFVDEIMISITGFKAAVKLHVCGPM